MKVTFLKPVPPDENFGIRFYCENIEDFMINHYKKEYIYRIDSLSEKYSISRVDAYNFVVMGIWSGLEEELCKEYVKGEITASFEDINKKMDELLIEKGYKKTIKIDVK